MICKECGAYNPDHAEFCKVCAANLKGKPAPAEPEVTEDVPQPTRRFSRPSWMPETTEQPAEETVAEPVVEEPVEEPVVDIEPEVEPVVEDETPEIEEEEPAPAWTPVQSRRHAARVKEEVEEESEEDESDEDKDEDEDEGIYNDEEALEDEDDSFEYEPTPPKRKQQKKKNNTLFTVLLIAIIVVIVGILVLGGYMLLKNQLNCGISSNKTNGDASQTGNLEPENPGDQAQQTEQSNIPDAKHALLQEMIDENNKDMIAITVVVPAHSAVVIDFPNQDDYKFENTDAKDITRKVKIPVEVFYLNQPLEDSTVEFHPDITINAADGSSYKVECASFTRTFPKLNITITAPVPEGDEPIMAPQNNQISLTGTIDDPTAEVSINGVVTTVYTGGVFMYDYKFADGVSEDTEDTITIVAKKNNCVSDTKEVRVHAYKFIPEPMKLEVKTDNLSADKNGKLTVTGTTLPGATLTAISDNATNVLCGSVNVDGEGNFSFQVTMDPGFYGMSAITLNAAKEGAENGSTKFTVVKGFADKKAFLKYYNKTKTYIEVVPKTTKNKITIKEMLDGITQYATNGYGFRVTAKVVEVSNNGNDVIIKMTVYKSGETIYVHKLSKVMEPENNIGKYYNIYGNFVGTYEDTGCVEFLGWFAEGQSKLKD
ncbi:MAG: zinc ribbon domain-containing protein [Clostridia bacterium]|nr:zinc ribbon domain-containing protein [Clostridia bacterium]